MTLQWKLTSTSMQEAAGEHLWMDVDAWEMTHAGLTAGTCVYISDNDTVATADADDAAGPLPAEGVIVRVITSTVCVVKFWGVATNVVSGATAGDQYYLSPTGTLTTTQPPGAGQIVQKIGVAKNATDLILNIQEDPVSV